MEFRGIPDEAYEYFLALRFNNNAGFFHAQHDWYLRAVRRPLLALAEALQPVLWEMDPQIDARPERVVSRLRRDTRFAKDKSPYRDYMWLGYRRFGEERGRVFLPYFDVGSGGCGAGMGCYGPEPSLMRAFRLRALAMPSEFLRAVEPCAGMTLVGEEYKRLPAGVPGSFPEPLRPWLMKKHFFLETSIPREEAAGPTLVGRVGDVFRALTPLYRFLRASAPAEDPKP